MEARGGGTIAEREGAAGEAKDVPSVERDGRLQSPQDRNFHDLFRLSGVPGVSVVTAVSFLVPGGGGWESTSASRWKSSFNVAAARSRDLARRNGATNRGAVTRAVRYSPPPT